MSPESGPVYPADDVDRIFEAFSTGNIDELRSIVAGMQAQIDRQQIIDAQRLAAEPPRIPILETAQGKAWVAARLADHQELV